MNRLILKLEQFAALGADDRVALADATRLGSRWVEAHRDLSPGRAPGGSVTVVLSGWICRYRLLDDGRRQIVAFLVPGDLCDLGTLVLHRTDDRIATLTPVLLAQLPREVLTDLMLCHPRLTQALWWDMLVASAIQRRWIVNLGQRSAAERIGHLLCELFVRMGAVGLVERDTCEMPLTQAEIASATGLSSVHVNRSLQELRLTGLIVLGRRSLHVPDLDALQAATHFNPDYLHLNRADAAAARSAERFGGRGPTEGWLARNAHRLLLQPVGGRGPAGALGDARGEQAAGLHG